tara:strand:+ start:449 stop:595 length:147 start_codon:yes stop_codon:yes gene_type:complete
LILINDLKIEKTPQKAHDSFGGKNCTEIKQTDVKRCCEGREFLEKYSA